MHMAAAVIQMHTSTGGTKRSETRPALSTTREARIRIQAQTCRCSAMAACAGVNRVVGSEAHCSRSPPPFWPPCPPEAKPCMDATGTGMAAITCEGWYTACAYGFHWSYHNSLSIK